MSTGQQIPPVVQEQLAKLQQAQQNLQMVLTQKQQLEFEQLETKKALEELNKANDDDSVFKHAGTILIKSNRKDLLEIPPEIKQGLSVHPVTHVEDVLKIALQLTEPEKFMSHVGLKVIDSGSGMEVAN